MNKKNWIIGALIVVLAAGGAFYGGMVYGKTRSRVRIFGNGQAGTFNTAFAGRGGMMRPNGGFVGGEIISKDDKSVTVKTQDGSTKIIFLADSTMVAKTAAGTKDDLTVGAQVIVTGTSNSDGTVTAQNIQIRPATGTTSSTPSK
ncbi:MAG TPA: hypothetical protein VL306_00615 [Methylomirabilota bacterium]|nr:hypothetical protein [Methylomirabilota bacterium]